MSRDEYGEFAWPTGISVSRSMEVNMRSDWSRVQDAMLSEGHAGALQMVPGDAGEDVR